MSDDVTAAREAYAAGRISKEEHDRRVDEALRNGGDVPDPGIRGSLVRRREWRLPEWQLAAASLVVTVVWCAGFQPEILPFAAGTFVLGAAVELTRRSQLHSHTTK